MATGLICTTDMHTGGEPLRIITSGYPEIKGSTVLEKRRYIKENFDHLRTVLMHEPRGHYDQYGAVIVEPDNPEADLGVIFMHNEGYSTMCGHAVIALGRYIVDNNLQKLNKTDKNGEMTTNIQCPCGLVKARVAVSDGVSGAVTFTSVPAFAYRTDITIAMLSYGDITFDVGYGGAFYALVDVNQINMDIFTTPCDVLVKFASELTKTVKEKINIEHPEEADLSFLYGTILTDGKDYYSSEATYNLCVFADKQFDQCYRPLTTKTNGTDTVLPSEEQRV